MRYSIQARELEQGTASEGIFKNPLIHSDRKFTVESWRIPGAKSNIDSDSNSFLTDQFFKSISSGHDPQLSQASGDSPLKREIKKEEVNVEYTPGNDDDYDQLSVQLNNLKLKSVNKVCPSRIYSMAFHPDPTKSLIFLGEKTGGVGIFDALGASSITTPAQVKTEDTDEQKNSNEEQEEPEFLEGTSCFIQVHTRFSAISSIQTHPTQSHLIYTSSYDESIRELNFETRDSIEILNGNEINPDGETLFSSFEFINSGREIWASDNGGGLSHRDLRSPKSDTSRWSISKKKIGCLSICPNSDDRMAVTAGLNREMRLWDLRALSGLPTNSGLSDIETKSCLANYGHRLACSSAFFNHSGDKILSTSYDDSIKIWEFDPSARSSWLNRQQRSLEPLNFKPTAQANHDNQTGRWVSVFKARWCPNPRFPSHFTVGNMNHKPDIYNPKGRLLTQLKHYSLTTVPAVTAQHPTSSTLQIAGGTAGGKVYLWS